VAIELIAIDNFIGNQLQAVKHIVCYFFIYQFFQRWVAQKAIDSLYEVIPNTEHTYTYTHTEA